MDGKTAALTQDDGAIELAGRASRSPNKVRFAWQQPRSSSGETREGGSAQDICSYPDSAFGPPFAPPRNRTGRAGGSWRHMRELRGARGQCVMFIQGDVKAHDNCKAATECLEQHGVPTFQVESPPVPPPLQLPPRASLKPRYIRAPRTKALESIYSEHARDGFVYWLEDKKEGCVKALGKSRLDEKGWDKYFMH